MIRIGTVFDGRFGIIEKIGSGGMADVYRAKDLKTGEIVAIKSLKQKFSKTPEYVSRFRAEGEAVSEIESPYVVRVMGVGESEGTYYLVMEYVDGITLKEYISRKTHLSAKETMAISAQITLGLRSAHAHRIIHRDVKPENVILTRNGKVKLTDFGIAEVRTGEEKTLGDGTLGSVHYISPEQVKGKEADERSDIYSLGICMYEMITGTLPFDKETAMAVALAHMNESMVPPSDHNPDCPIALEQIIFRCTQKSREKRYHSCTELLKDLKIAVETPDFNFEKQEQERVMMSSTHVFSKNETNALRKENAEREAVRKAAKKEERTTFDHIMQILAIALGALMFGLLLYIILSFSGCLSGTGSMNTPSRQNGYETDEDPTIIVITKDPNEFDPETDTKVPDMIGMTLQQAMQALEDAELNFQLSYQQEYSEAYPMGSVIRQSYEGGTVVLKDSTIVIVLNSGKGYFDIKKNYVGRNIADFRTDIAEYKSYITVEEKGVYSRSVPINQIMSISPSSGRVNAGDKITVTYSNGKPYALMPDLTGMTEEEAKKALNDVLLKLGKVDEDFDDEVEKGKICYQQYKAGMYLREGTTVAVSISKGKEKLALPDLTGMTKEEADETLKDAGYRPVYVNWYEESGEDLGKVRGQYPEAGTKLEPGNDVMVYVSSSSDTVILPDVVGKKFDSEVKKLLHSLPFKFIIHEETVAAEEEEEDLIITGIRQTDPSAPLSKGAEITVTYKTTTFSKISMPNLLQGLTLDEAKTLLQSQGFSIDEEHLIVTYEKTEIESLDGIVSEQSPEANSDTTTLVKVELKVFRYEAPAPSESESETPEESSSETEAPPESSSESVPDVPTDPVESSETQEQTPPDNPPQDAQGQNEASEP